MYACDLGSARLLLSAALLENHACFFAAVGEAIRGLRLLNCLFILFHRFGSKCSLSLLSVLPFWLNKCPSDPMP